MDGSLGFRHGGFDSKATSAHGFQQDYFEFSCQHLFFCGALIQYLVHLVRTVIIFLG
jgi:hypothetical protein